MVLQETVGEIKCLESWSGYFSSALWVQLRPRPGGFHHSKEVTMRKKNQLLATGFVLGALSALAFVVYGADCLFRAYRLWGETERFPLSEEEADASVA